MSIYIINMRLEYLDTDTVLDVEYLDSNTDGTSLNRFGLEYSQKIYVSFSSLITTTDTN